MIYQVNARSMQPFYTTDRARAVQVYQYLRQYGPSCSLRAIPAARALYKITRAR